MKNLPILAYIALAFAWGMSYALNDIIVRDMRPFPLATLRALFGLLFLLGVALFQRPTLPRLKTDWLAMMVPGILGSTIPYLIVAWSQQYVDSSLTAIIITSTSIFTMVVAHLTLHDERMTPKRIIGVLVGFGGVVVLMSRNFNGAPQTTMLATASLVLVAICYAVSSVFARRFTTQHSPIVQSIVAQGTALVLIGSVTPFTEDAFRAPQFAQTWIALVVLGCVSSGMAFMMFFYLIRTIGPTRTQTVNYLILVIGVSIGVLLLGEMLVWEMVLGAAMIVGGLVVVNWPQAKSP